MWLPRARRVVAVVAAAGLMPLLQPPLSASYAAGTRAGHAHATRSGPSRKAAIAAAQRGPTDPGELQAFLDELFAGQMAEFHIPGAAVAVVKDGELLLARGYGFADVDRQIPVDPERTIFRIGSVGKAITWTAVMQLVEQGQLDLDADIDDTLDLPIPDPYAEPITLRHLMTHTSGFEDRHFGSAVTDPRDLVPTRAWLEGHLWKRVRPPGLAGYSNYNAILAGHIVERVTGQAYGDYVQEHIFDRLGMAHATAWSPIPPALRPDASVGYTYAGGAYTPFPDYIGQPAGLPSGAHQATVADMARFMIARLEGGRYHDAALGDARILSEPTARRMLETLYAPDPRLRGTAYGLFDWSENGQRVLGHTGYGPPMHSVMFLLPDARLGVFASFNAKGGGAVNGQHAGLQKAFLDHYYPAPAAPAVRPPADFAARAERFVGQYNAYRDYTTLLKVIGLFGGGYTVEVADPGDGTLSLRLEGQTFRLAEVEPLYFRQVDGPFAAVFHADPTGRITALSFDAMPQYAVSKLAWHQTARLNMLLLQGFVGVFLAVLVVAAIRGLRALRPSGQRPPAPRWARAAEWVLAGIAVSNLLVLAVLAWGAMGGLANELLDLPTGMKALLGFGVLSTGLTVGAVVAAVRAWREGWWSPGYRLYYAAGTVAAVAFVWFLDAWNLLGWRL